MAFPANPSNNQVTVLNGSTYTYSTANNAWSRVPNGFINTLSIGGNSFIASGNVWIGDITTFTSNVSFTGNITGNVGPSTANSSASSIGYLGVPQNAQSSAYTLTLGDLGKQIYLTSNANITIPDNSVTSFPVGAAMMIATGPSTYSNILINSDTLYFVGNAAGQTGKRYMVPFSVASITKMTSTTWFISGAGLS